MIGKEADGSPNDVAVIGMSCRLPGDVRSPSEYWDFLLAEGDGIIPIPADRWDNKAYYDADREKKNRMYVNKGGFIGGIDQFDPLFFGMSPAEASRVDPQHRWLLELTYEALENAGLRAKEMKGTDTAVFIGQFMHDYEQLQLDSMAHGLINSHSATGPSMTLTANRISYVFDFRGPSVTLDTACSSSLVALDLACKAVLSGDSQVGLAGGVNILLRPELTMSICKASMLSPDGHCKSFDAAADGYVRSEGAGIVLVKKLTNARRDGNNILAVIKATAVNQDGFTPGITVPSGEAQKRLLLKSLKHAGIEGETIQYIEAHGTGTAVGDPIEVNALGAILGRRARDAGPCVIGSVKSNIGHTEAAAGVAGLIKTVLAIHHGAIPKNIHYHSINPAINLQELNLRVADELLAWPDTQGRPRRALINSFGFGGTNANVVLEEAPKAPGQGVDHASLVNGSVRWLPLSAKSEKGLKDIAAKYLDYFSRREASKLNQVSAADLHDICYTAATKRDQHDFRLVVSGSSGKQIQEGLYAFLGGVPSPAHVSGRASGKSREDICFVFSGMGTQWAGMGRELYQTEPAFRREMDLCSVALERYTGWSLVDVIFSDSDVDKINDTSIAQPGIFAVQVGLSALLESWGILPGRAVGHSAGEVGAAYISGVLTFEDAIKVIYHRSRLQQTTEGMGKMLAVGLSEVDLLPYLSGTEARVSIGAINSADTITLAGEEATLTIIAARLEEKGIFNRFLNVGVPYHSPVMDQLANPLIEALKDIVVRVPRLPLYSTVSGRITQPGDWGPSYWADNVRQPVLFKNAVETIIKDGGRAFLEVAPHAALAGSIGKNLANCKVNGIVATTLKRSQNDVLMVANALSSLHVAGCDIDWARLFPNGGRFVSLPNYAWQHASYWCEAPEVQHSRMKNVSNRNGFLDTVHPLVGSKLNSLERIWQKLIDLQDHSYLADHQVEGEVVYPAASYIEMALGIAHREYKKEQISLEDIEFKRALFLHAEKPTLVESTVSSDGSSLRISAVDAHTGQWNIYSEVLLTEIMPRPPARCMVLADLIATRPSVLQKTAFYKHCHKLGLSYRAHFQVVETAWFNENQTIVELVLPEALLVSSNEYLLHPAILDGAFQGVFPVLERGYLPVRIEALHYHKRPSSKSYCSVTITSRTAADVTGELVLFDPDGTITVEIVGIQLKSTNTQEGGGNAVGPMLYDFAWQQRPYANVEVTPLNAKGSWIIFADAKGVGRRLAAELEGRRHSVFVVAQSDFQNRTDRLEQKTGAQSSAGLASILKRFAAYCSGIVYLWGLDNDRDESLSGSAVLENCRTTTVMPMYLAQAIDRTDWRSLPQIYFVTQSAHSFEGSVGLPQPSQGALWGFGRVFSTEFPAYKFSLIDLADSIDDGLVAKFADQLLLGENEQEIALRSDVRYVNRVRPMTESVLHDYLGRQDIRAGDRPFRIVQRPKAAGGSKIAATAFTLPELKPSEVRVNVDCAAFNPRDLENISKPDTAVKAAGLAAVVGGYACVGTVAAIGPDVKEFSPGTPVLGFCQQSLASAVHASAKLMVKTPDHLLPEEALTIPAAFLPAHYALNYLAQLKEGENVLIHEAADTIGRAAIQFARLKRANVFVSARTLEKRAMLTALGIEQVYDSNTYDFVEQIMRATKGRGIDVVLNVLSGQFVNKTLSILRPFGRFIEFGPKPTSHSALVGRIFNKNLSYHSVDLSELVIQRAELCAEMLGEVIALFTARLLSPLPVELFSSANLREMVSRVPSSGRFEVAGLRFDKADVSVGPEIDRKLVNRKSTYLVTGGLGGLGLEVMSWLVGAGAQSIVLIGRSDPSENARRAIDMARVRGATITSLRADVSNPDDLRRVLRMIDNEMLPLAGIVHAAGSLDDGVIAQQTADKFEKVLAPKIQGAWNLHQLTEHIVLDFFICFSSIASVVGWAGQSNYAAANGFIDTLAHHRRALGKSALTINWGPWSGSGMAANLDTRDIQRMTDAGMSALKPEVALTALTHLLMYHVTQAGVFDMDWARLAKKSSSASPKSLLKDLVDPSVSSIALSFSDQLRAASPDMHENMLAEKISSLLAEVLGIESSSSIDRSKNVADYGVNSLMAMDLRNRLQGLLNAKLPATLVLKYPTVDAMAKCVLERGVAENTALGDEKLYWTPASAETILNHEINGPLATLTPSVQNWIHEGHTTHFNVGALVQIDASKFDLGALKIALRIVLTYHDGSRLQLFAENGELGQAIVSLGHSVELAEHDLRDLGRERGVAKMEELNDRYQRSFSFARGERLYRAAYYQIDDNEPHRFFLIFHHYVSDAMSQKIFWQTLVKVYSKVLNKEAVSLPEKTTTLIDWTRRLREFAYGEAVNQLPYWLDKITRSRACFIADEFTSTRERQLDDYVIHTGKLERKEYEDLVEYCRIHNFEISDAGTYALVKAFSILTRADSLWVDLITHARSGILDDIEIPELFGQISESASLLFQLVPDGSHAEQIQAMRKQRLDVPSGGIGLRALRFINKSPAVRAKLMKDESPQVGLNFDVTDYEAEAGETWVRFAKEKAGSNQSTHLRKTADMLRLAFFVDVKARNGCLSAAIGYYKDRFYPETIASIVNNFFSVLKDVGEGVGGDTLEPPAVPATSAELSGTLVAEASHD